MPPATSSSTRCCSISSRFRPSNSPGRPCSVRLMNMPSSRPISTKAPFLSCSLSLTRRTSRDQGPLLVVQLELDAPDIARFLTAPVLDILDDQLLHRGEV